MTESDPKPPNRAARRRWRRAHTAVAVVIVVTMAAGAGVYMARRVIARELLVGWLDARGVPAQVEFRQFDYGGFIARVRAGPAGDPDASVERVEVRYGFTGPWAGRPLGVEVASIKLYRPVLKGRFRDGKFSLGSLDRVIEAFTRQPPRPDARQPRIEIHRGVLSLTTDYGALKAYADGRMEDGKLMALDARLDPARLKGAGLDADLGQTTLRLATTGPRVDLVLVAPVNTARFQGGSVKAARLNLSLQGPYPDMRRQRGDGRLFARAELSGEEARLGADSLQGVRLTGDFTGAVSGWARTLALQGDGTLKAAVAGGKLAGTQVDRLGGDASLGDIRWTRSAGDVVSAEISARFAADRVLNGDLTLSAPHGDLDGLIAFDPERLDVALRGAIQSRGAWSGLGPARAGDLAETAALKRALAGFQLTANSVAVNATRDDLSISLGTPVRLRTDSGGEALFYRSGAPVYANGRGGFGLTVKGGGLPEVDLDVARYSFGAGGLAAELALKAKGGFAPVSGASLDAAGELRVAGGTTTFAASRCIAVGAEHVELGDNDLAKVDGSVCPTGGPLLSLAGGRWHVRGLAKDLSAELPATELRIAEGAGTVDLSGAGERIDGQVTLARAKVADTAAEMRFRPVLASGAVQAKGGAWTGGFALSDLARRRLAEGTLAQGRDGRGGVRFDTGMLTFAPGGLQPAGLSPMAAVLASPAEGRARFVGQMDWGEGAPTSRGTLLVERLDFVSPMGPVTGLSGQAQFASLLPLEAAPGQFLKAEKIDTLVPLTDVQVSFGLESDAVVVEGAQLAMGDGKLVFDPFTLPFKPGEPWKGAINIEAVQVKDLVEASPFGDRVDLEARLTGRAPFEVTPQGVRVSGGVLRAIEPGRLSILREAFTTVGAEGGGVSAPVPVPEEAAPEATNAITEFAYQAMEHLAFDTLDAQVDSQDNGRLGVLMHLKGEHTPPKKQEIRLTIMELLRQSFMDKSLPLPSGTKVDLTLDTSINLDQILKDFAEYQALRGSQAVQP
ncbi:YdbH domain-containing protein [Phenylobacterium sp.]|uniref:intermembrane phospholipid transport protein YdbH family protein n=1 Tax=Phenylobacterium sp. TaxID=1871053 RepID=UPI0035AE2440